MTRSLIGSNDSWPPGANPNRCPVFARNEILIQAEAATIWSYLVDASRWPQWYPYAANVKLQKGSDELALGVSFAWRTFSINVASQVEEWRERERIAWNAKAPFVRVYHRWTISRENGFTRVRTEETERGLLPSLLRLYLRPRLRRQHQVWLQNLKCISEGFGDPAAPHASNERPVDALV